MGGADPMRSALLTAPGKIVLRELELPPPGTGELRVRVEQSGVCASELSLWNGKETAALPAEIGHEVAGVVEEVGADVELAVGDHVVVWIAHGGGFAPALIAEERHCIRVAPGLNYPAVAEPLSCVSNAVELTRPALGDDVVIVGAGFMGHLIQLVSARKGPRSILVADVRPDALARAAALGATRVVDTRTESLAAAVREATDGRGVDVAYEVTGVQAGLELAGEVVRIGGALCVVGYHLGGSRTIPLGDWNWRALRILNAHFRDVATIMEGMRAGMRLVEAGALDVAPLMTHVYPLDRVADAFADAAARPDGFVKAVVEPGR